MTIGVACDGGTDPAKRQGTIGEPGINDGFGHSINGRRSGVLCKNGSAEFLETLTCPLSVFAHSRHDDGQQVACLLAEKEGSAA